MSFFALFAGAVFSEVGKNFESASGLRFESPEVLFHVGHPSDGTARVTSSYDSQKRDEGAEESADLGFDGLGRKGKDDQTLGFAKAPRHSDGSINLSIDTVIHNQS